ncbi:hypothetical protein [Mycobacterium kiyosense]|uniref:hypothetical protein n=1 Tax=Mycobacterium kiyosense TaxID=2871094 RepID=UPI001F339F65|nr:hypothetical protein [Mycobacterium kiyosense]
MRTVLSGDTGDVQVNWGFASAVRSFTKWPVAIWAAVIEEHAGYSPLLRTFYWIQDNVLGQLTIDPETSTERPTITGTVQSVSNIDVVDLSATVVDDNCRVVRTITARFRDGNHVTVSAAHSRMYLNDQANKFIDALLDAVASC